MATSAGTGLAGVLADALQAPPANSIGRPTPQSAASSWHARPVTGGSPLAARGYPPPCCSAQAPTEAMPRSEQLVEEVSGDRKAEAVNPQRASPSGRDGGSVRRGRELLRAQSEQLLADLGPEPDWIVDRPWSRRGSRCWPVTPRPRKLLRARRASWRPRRALLPIEHRRDPRAGALGLRRSSTRRSTFTAIAKELTEPTTSEPRGAGARYWPKVLARSGWPKTRSRSPEAAVDLAADDLNIE